MELVTEDPPTKEPGTGEEEAEVCVCAYKHMCMYPCISCLCISECISSVGIFVCYVQIVNISWVTVNT